MADRGQMRHHAILFEASWRTQLTVERCSGPVGYQWKALFLAGREGIVANPTSRVDGDSLNDRTAGAGRGLGQSPSSRSGRRKASHQCFACLSRLVGPRLSRALAFRSRNSLRVVTDRGQMRHRVILVYGVVADSFVCFLARRQPRLKSGFLGVGSNPRAPLSWAPRLKTFGSTNSTLIVHSIHLVPSLHRV
ncbi:hypothetical protein B0H16DRAFT_1450503 [Mycena metata]|uniref:Uncharacterized protein n=1 Tax=Mycena metata TaxID=1033252 RepID=A0AAD7NUE4_9AGAR|nr:hypothetical protein B0H16DRAFT_1450503 [Mycena metata]